MLIADMSTDTLLRLTDALGRSVAADKVDDDLVSALDEVLVIQDRPAPAAPSRVGSVLARLPYRPSRPRRVKAAPISDEDFARIAFHFRRATPQFIARATERVHPAPLDLIGRLRTLHEEKPEPDAQVGYLRRYADTLLAVLDLVGDDDA